MATLWLTMATSSVSSRSSSVKSRPARIGTPSTAGIRIALGASPRAVAAAMARCGIALAGVGIVFGLGLFTLVARFLRGLLFGVSAGDPVTLGGSALILFAIAILACWVPARRAARVDPAEALRAE